MRKTGTRPLAAVTALAFAAIGVTGCGDDDGAGDAAAREQARMTRHLERELRRAVTVSGGRYGGPRVTVLSVACPQDADFEEGSVFRCLVEAPPYGGAAEVVVDDESEASYSLTLEGRGDTIEQEGQAAFK